MAEGTNDKFKLVDPHQSEADQNKAAIQNWANALPEAEVAKRAEIIRGAILKAEQAGIQPDASLTESLAAINSRPGI